MYYSSTVQAVSDEKYKHIVRWGDGRDEASCGQKLACVFCLYGPKAYTDKVKELVKGLFADKLLYVLSGAVKWLQGVSNTTW